MRLLLLVSRPFLLALTLVLLTGCDPIIRTYGGYGTVEAHQAQIRLAVENFEAAHARNRADLTRLSQMAAANPSLGRTAEGMAQLVNEQDLAVQHHRARLDELAREGDYRKLNRAYGALITEHQMFADRYAALVGRVQMDTTRASYVGSVVEKARYFIVPPQYYRVNNRVRTPMLVGQAGTAPASPSFVTADTSAATTPDTTSAAADTTAQE